MEKSFFEEERRRRSKKPTPLKPESLWQAFFEENQWVFGYGLNLVACESYDPAKLELPTTGANAFDGAGKRVDALLRTRGQLSSLMFCEIKRHDTPLLDPKPYRIPDVYRPSEELSGAVCQVQKTADKAIRAIRDHLYAAYNRDGAPMRLRRSDHSTSSGRGGRDGQPVRRRQRVEQGEGFVLRALSAFGQ